MARSNCLFEIPWKSGHLCPRKRAHLTCLLGPELHALALGCAIVTEKEKEFSWVKGLFVENWPR